MFVWESALADWTPFEQELEPATLGTQHFFLQPLLGGSWDFLQLPIPGLVAVLTTA